MLNREIDSILYQSYIKLGQITNEIAVNSREGLDGTKYQDGLWDRAIQIDITLDVIQDHIEIKDGKVYRLIGITEDEMNQLLDCLVSLAKITDYPVAGFLASKNLTKLVDTGGGLPGPPGTNGTNAFIAVVFASDDIGTGFSSSPSPVLPYIAFKSSNSAIPMTPVTFAGLWVKYIGENGLDGQDGADGITPFLYVRYASDAVGSNFSASPAPNRKYVAYLASPTDLGTPPSTAFNGLWVKYVGDNGLNGVDGQDGNTILVTSGPPSNSVGTDGDVAFDQVNKMIHGPKASGVWPPGISLVGPPGPGGTNGTNGTNGTDGANAYLYMAWADDASGNGFTTIFDPNKEWIATIQTTTELTTLTAGDFAGKWAHYKGAGGDRWRTVSSTNLSIISGVKSLLVEKNLAYSTGQRIVIAHTNDPANRMEGTVIAYDPSTGQLTADIDTTLGSGTFNIWSVNLAAGLSANITADSYFAELYVSGNSGGTPAAISTTPAKVDMLSVGDVSAGMAASATTDNITAAIGGEFHIYANVVLEGDASESYIFKIFKNGTAIPGVVGKVTLDAANSPATISLKALITVITSDVYDLRVEAATGTPDLLIHEARFGMFTTGTPATPEYTEFGGIDFDTGTGIIVDAFDAMLGNAVIWEYKMKKGNNIRTGRVQGCWKDVILSPADWASDNFYTLSLGTIDVTITMDVNGGNVRLLANITSDDWEISGNRYIL